MRFLYIASTGTNDPTKASIPFHIAGNGALERGHEATIVLAGDAADLLLGDTPKTLEGVGVPPLRELIEKVKGRAAVYV